MQICPLLFVRMPPQWAVEEEWAPREGKKEAFVAALGEDKTVCAGKLIPLLNLWVSVMISRYGASGTGVDEVPVCFWHG